MAPLAILDLDHPQVRVIAQLALGEGVDLALWTGLDRPDPKARPVRSERLRIKSRLSRGGVEHLDQHPARARVAAPRDRGEGPAQFGAADQGGDPDVGRKQQRINRARKRGLKLPALGSGS
jgi:hypothetical protein